MAFVKDLWFTTTKNPETGETSREKSKRHGKGKRWLAVWVDPNGRERSRAFQKKTDADNHADSMSVDALRGDYIDPKAGEVLFGTVAERWFSSRVVDPSSKIRYEQVYRLHVEPHFARRQVKGLAPSQIQARIGELADTHGASTIATAFLIIQGVLDLAVADEAIKKNPAKSPVVQVPKWTGQKIVPWADESVYGVIDAHPEHLKPIPVLGAACGLRQGELFGVALEDFDFEERVLYVRRQIKKLGRVEVYALPKSDRERVVPLPEWAAQTIQQFVKAHKPRPYTLPWEKPEGKDRTVNLLSRWADDKHLRARLYNEQTWRPALVGADLAPQPTKDARGRLRYANDRRDGMHALRHYYASVLLAEGVSIRELAEYLGHSDPGFTLRTYIHMLPDSHERAINAIDGRHFRPRAIPAPGRAHAGATVAS
jgi:integrase